MAEPGWMAEKLMLPLLLHRGSFSSASSETFMRFAEPPMGRGLLAMASMSYRFISKLVTAFMPLNLIAAMSYASAASSSVATQLLNH